MTKFWEEQQLAPKLLMTFLVKDSMEAQEMTLSLEVPTAMTST